MAVRVRDINPLDLLAIPPEGGRLQPYLPRDVDRELDAALRADIAVLLVIYEPDAGARRATYEALMRNRPDDALATAGAGADEAATIVWCGETSRQLLDELARGRQSAALLIGFVNERDDMLSAIRDRIADLSHRTVRVSGRFSETERAAFHSAYPELPEPETLYAYAYETPDLPAAPPVPAAVERLAAGYHADTDDGTDRLGFAADVDMLAELVVSRLVRPPLSIGLFGNWGSGKSFFMRLMRERIRAIADAAAAENERTSYCSSVRQITFNAWHYAEANLWASLATHIFDSLAAGGSEDDLRRRADELAAQRKTAESLLDQLSLVRLERMTVAARQERLPGALGLTPDDLAWVARTLGVDRATAADVRRFADEVVGLGTEARRAGTLLWRSRFALATLGVGVVLAVALGIVLRGPVAPLVTAAASVLVAATPVITKVREAITRIRRAAASARATTGQRLAALDAEVERLERAIAELAPAHDVTAFAMSRRASTDYRQHLGVVSLLRHDLETFAAILDRERTAGGLERIVLYVDDLDRCPPDVVVKVLEAIHLLVALPVFVVVVGVDARWLRQAIRRHYAAMLPDDSVTPAHYLEKIFQIPFQLSTMDKEGFANLVHELTTARETVVEVELPREILANSPDPLATEQAREQVDRALEQVGISPPPRDLRPRRLEISPEEADLLTRFASLVPSPRAAKRLVNLYQLVRARLGDGDPAEARAAAVLLALQAGDSTTLLDRLSVTQQTSWREFLQSEGAQDRDVAALCALLTEIDGLPGDLAVYRRWLPLIRRFSFGH